MIMDAYSILIGLVLGVLAASKTEQARFLRLLSGNKKNMGTFDIVQKGKGVSTFVLDYNTPDLTVRGNKFINNPDRVLNKGGRPHAYANEDSTELIDMNAQSRDETIPFKCECGKEYDLTVQTMKPLVDPKAYNDIVLRAISWGMTILQDKKTQMILIFIGVAVIVGIINALIGYNNMQAQGSLSGQIAELKETVVAGFNTTVGR
ncbi:MAG: hypothetical protein Sv326_1327 (plasmid) [Candidatus Fermentimicrarchaeum limneticum]|uniref:Uncharacterized protein n=1 Tax=Fermentimicrarchaeum limneticum TaxID=2795018 RepID=A0A7D6BPI5_FERL1|nr:MAG: hypothetical protein Sv326_1327 [Candidatus Fermentimicrarchaeum limneticum]